MWLPRKVASPLVHCPPPPAQAPNSGIILDSSLLHTPPSHLSTHPVSTVFGIYPDPDHISPPLLLPPQEGPRHYLSLDSGLTGLPASALALCGPFSTQGKGRSFLNVRQIRSSLRSISSTPPVSLRAKALPPSPPQVAPPSSPAWLCSSPTGLLAASTPSSHVPASGASRWLFPLPRTLGPSPGEPPARSLPSLHSRLKELTGKAIPGLPV